MTEKKHEKQSDEGTNEAPPDALEARTGQDVELESLRKRLDEAQAKAAENLDGWQRSVPSSRTTRSASTVTATATRRS